MLRVYVGCPLTRATPEFLAEVGDLKLALEPHCQVLDFLGLGTGATPREIWEHDIGKCVTECDLMVAICDQSLGLGIEIATAIWLGKPILAVAHHTTEVSNLVLDPPVLGYEFRRFGTMRDVLCLVVERLKKLERAAARQSSLFDGEPMSGTKAASAAGSGTTDRPETGVATPVPAVVGV